MSNEPMTRKQVDDLIEKVSLKFTIIVSDKLEEYGNKQKEEQRLARENTFEQGTGFPWEDRGHVKAALSYAHRAQKNASIWRGASIVAITGLVIKAFWGSFFNV